MSSKIELYCWVLGNELNKISPVQIEKTLTITHLRTAIKEEKENTLRGHDSDTLALWKFSMVKEEVHSHLAQINLDSLPDHDKLRSLRAISQVFLDPPEDGHLYLVVMQPGGECGVFAWDVPPLMFHSAQLSKHD
jgi:hypothetical protein